MSKQILLAYLHKLIYFIVMPIQISIYTSTLSVENYGLLNLIVTTSVMATVLFSFGLHSYSAITIPKFKYNRQLYIFKNILIFEILSFSFLFFIFISLINFLEIVKLTSYDFYIIFFAYLFFLIMNEFGKFYSYQHKIEIRLILGIFELLLIISTLFIVNKYIEPLTIRTIILIYFSVYVFLTLIYIYIIKKKKFFCTNLNYPLIKKAIMFSVPLIFADLSFKLMQNIDSYLLLYYNLEYDLGIYSFTIKIINTLYLVSAPILWIFYPYLVKYFESNKNKFYYYLDIQLRYTGLITLFGLTIFMINLEYLIAIIATTEYIEHKSYYYLVSIYPFLLLYLYSSYQILMINKKKDIILLSYLVGLAINTIFSFILISLYGIYGAFISTIFGLLSILIIMLCFLDGNYRSIIIKYFLVFLFYLLLMILFLIYNLSVVFINIYFLLSFTFLAYYLNIHQDIYLFFKKRQL